VVVGVDRPAGAVTGAVDRDEPAEVDEPVPASAVDPAGTVR
jgi:hypothetical protein